MNLSKSAPGTSLLALTFAVMAAGSARGQFSAGVSGTVEDTTGAIIPGATVTLINLGTQQTQTAVTSPAGFYSFNQLAPAHYKLTFAANGFKGENFEDVEVTGATPRNLDAKLATGGNNETVEVNADDVPLLQTSSANVQRTLSSEEIQRLPIFGSDPYELLRTAPGITGDGARGGTGGAVFLPGSAGPGGSNSGIFQTENQIQISADGQRVADNNYTIDGVSVNSLGRGGAAVVTPNQESVQSITVISTSYDAADGRNSGAQIKTISKSGTNNLHGSLYFLYNEPGLNSFNSYGGPQNALPVRVNIKQRNYATSLGGPIIKDKLFLFGSFQGFSQASNSTVTSYLETAQYRADVIANRPGGITAFTLADPNVAPRIRNVITSDCSGYANDQARFYPKAVNDVGPIVVQTAQSGPYCQVVNGGLDIGSLTPGGASQLGHYLPFFNGARGTAANPGPANRVGGGYVGGGLDGIPDVQQVQLNVPAHSRGKQYNGRVDYSVTKNDQLAGSVYFTKLDNLTSSDASSRAQGDVPFKPLNSAATIIYIHTFSPTWLNEFRANGTRFRDDGQVDFGNINLGIPFTDVESIPISRYEFGVAAGSTTGAGLAQNTIELSDQATHTFGSHIIKFGGGIRWEQDNNNLSGGSRPSYAFAGPFNYANDAPFFENATYNPNTGLAGITQRYYRSQTLYGFIQHDWKVTPTLSFNAGFRYEIYTPYHNKGFQTFEPVSGGPGNEVAGIRLQSRDNLYNSDYGHYAPKLAFAWTPNYYDGKVVLRGGFGIAYNHLDVSLFENALQNGPGVVTSGVFGAGTPQDGFTPDVTNVIRYERGTSNSITSYPVNPAFATGTNALGFPNGLQGAQAPQIQTYGVAPVIKNPMSYLYSLESETLLTGGLTLTVGYAGSVGHHYARLVNQNLLFPQTVNGVTTPVNGDFLAQTDSNQAYNALNVRVVKRLARGLQFDTTYTFSKSIDNITSGDFSDGSANQTNPGNNKSERGPSDYDTRNRITGTILYTSPKVHTGHSLLDYAANGYQISSILTFHSGFRWTPVTDNGNVLVPGSSVINPIRPIAFAPGISPAQFGTSCSNSAFQTGSNFPDRGANGTLGGQQYFSTAQPTGQSYTPIIGRNSLAGPCYRDIDLSIAKQVQVEKFGHNAIFRVQANLYNAFNILQLQPITNQGFGTNIRDQNFGRSGGADAGRVMEFVARVSF